MIDQYHYMAGEEFWKKFQDQIPEHLQARIEKCLVNEADSEELAQLQYDNDDWDGRYSLLEDELYELERDYSKLESDYEDCKDELIALKEKLKKLTNVL